MATLPFLIIAALQCAPTAHQPAPDVAYQEGVSAKGWAVAPADLPSVAHGFDEVELDLALPASRYSNNELLQNQFPFATLDAGDVSIHQDGTTELNGRPIGDEACE